MDDPIAREGTLARCNADTEAVFDDQECINARRAAIALTLQEERERLEAFERESERRLEALRRRTAEAERRAREAEAAAAALAAVAEDEEYERTVREQTAPPGEADQAVGETDWAADGVSSSEPASDPAAEWPGDGTPLPF